MRRSLYISIATCLNLVLVACGGGGNDSSGNNGGGTQPPVTQAAYSLLAWSELGMHCMDGKDYSIMSVLPPYNTIHAQLIKRGDTPQVVTSGVTITYEAIADTTNSTNTSSAQKTNFWTFVQALFHAAPAPDTGLAGYAVQSNTPQKMSYNAQFGAWEAVGIPTVPYDDAGARNAYPMVKVVARDSSNSVLATARVVLAVSDEISCNVCHSSNSNPQAMPSAGWVNNADAAKDTRLNILRKHDDRHNISGLLPALQANGYTYQASLETTATGGTPILCAACHATNALGAAGMPGLKPVTAAVHSAHATVVNPATGTTLDNAGSPAGSCYLCHPGLETKCQRGAMNGIACFDCHGNLSVVGASTRQGWLDVPNCQMCHNTSTRNVTTFAGAAWRTTSDTTFATQPNVPAMGKSLFRFSRGHGGVYCSGCHGSPHAEFPTNRANDNLYSNDLQQYSGKLTECVICHTNTSAMSTTGPHNMHSIGQAWVGAHPSSARGNLSTCAYCHGWNYRGSFLSQTKIARTLKGDDGKTVSYAAGAVVTCYDCHNGPNGD